MASQPYDSPTNSHLSETGGPEPSKEGVQKKASGDMHKDHPLEKGWTTSEKPERLNESC